MNNIVNRLLSSEKKILVIGDVILDKYLFGDIQRLSPEAPVPIMTNTQSCYCLGGAANVCANIRMLGGKVDIIGCIGTDTYAAQILELFVKYDLSPNYIFRSSEMTTTVKTRYISKMGQHLLRVDREQYYEYSNPGEVIQRVEKIIDKYDVIVFSDYAKGFLSERLIMELLLLAKKHKKVTIVDPKSASIERYKNSYLIKPNYHEFIKFYGNKNVPLEYIIHESEQILHTLGVNRLLVTCGDKGIVYLRKGMPPFCQTAYCRRISDVTGAGDIVTAVLAIGLSCGLSEEDSICLANQCAGVTVEKAGTSCITFEDLVKTLPYENKLLDNITLLAKFRDYYKNKKIVFTNGCFDLLHSGHMDLIKKAKEYGDVLVVGINSDASIQRIKGKNRPICDQHTRSVLMAIQSEVDWVVLFDSETPLELIRQLKPDVLVKGDDYRKDQVIGHEFVESRGGEVVLIPHKYNVSTTDIISHIRLQGD